MTTTLTDITRYENGARFYTADLHIHSYGASADVSDSSMTVERIIEDAVKENLAVISITDHNTDRHVQKSLEYGAKYLGRLLVLPGVEVTTANGHLLVYFPPERPELVGMLLGRIGLQGTPGARDSHTTGSMADVIRDAERLGGLCVAAHVDRAKMGFEMMIQGHPNAKRDIIASSGLFGLEFDNSEHLNWYSYDDEPTPEGAARKQILSARQTSSATAARLNLAAVQNSDAHSLNDFRGQLTQREASVR